MPLAIQTIAMLSIYIVPFILILTVPMNGWIALLLTVVMGTGVAGIGMCVMHDAVHGSYSNKGWINKVLGATMYLLGSNVFNWKIQHNILHHVHPSVEYTKMVFLKAIYLLVIIGLPIIITSFSWWQVLLGFFVMHWTAGCILSTIFQMAHVVEGTEQPMPNKDGIIETEWAVHELHTTSDFARNNLFLNWYVGGLNFQIEHHLFPNISHIHYRKIAPIVQKTAEEYGFNYNLKSSFINALSSHVKRLKELGK